LDDFVVGCKKVSKGLAMPSQVPDDWISEAEVIKATKASPRNLAHWRARGIVVGKRRSLGRGKGTTACFYPPDTVSLIRRLYELQRVTRDVDRWVWQLWREGFSTDVQKWALKRLRGERKVVERAGPAGVAKAALQAAKTRPDSLTDNFKPVRRIFGRIRKPADREALFSWVGAALAGYEQQASIHNAEPPIFDIALKAMGIPRATVPPPKVDLDRLSLRWFHQTLVAANHEELEQARRDWQGIARLTEALETTDWNATGPELGAKIEDLTKSRPEPPSKRQRKARRRRPYARPAVVNVYLEGLLEPKNLPYLLALLVGFRRSSRENSTALTQAIALAETLVSRLPQRTKDTTPPEPTR
jgi:hypothetical protein